MLISDSDRVLGDGFAVASRIGGGKVYLAGVVAHDSFALARGEGEGLEDQLVIVIVNTRYVNWMGWAGFTEVSRSLGSLTALITSLTLNSREQITQFNMLDWNHADNSPYYVHWIWYYNYGGTNNNGNLLGMTEYNSPALTSVGGSSLSPAVNTSFTYDGVNRLASVTDTSYARSFCYDAYGNGWVTSYSGNPGVSGNAPQEKGGSCPVGSGATPYVAGTNRLAGVSYDGVGNQTSIFQGDTTVYDAEGRVTAVMNGATTVAAYQYDADGRRVQKTTAAGTTNYVYDDSGALLAEYAGAALTKEYVRFHSEYIPSNVDLVAVENATASGSGCTTCFVIPDYLGNVRMVADNAGNASSRHDYLPFGEEAVADRYRLSSGGFGGADGLTQRFTGKERDAEEGLDYFGARYYGSVFGRFTSPDLIKIDLKHASNPQKWNQYAYSIDSPQRYLDPDGFEEIDVQLRAFIQQKTVIDPLGRRFAGDGRGFTAARSGGSRTSIVVRIETDPSIRPGNPIISITEPGTASPTRLLDAIGDVVAQKTASTGLPKVVGGRDASGNATLDFTQDTKNPFELDALTPGISADLGVTVGRTGSWASIVGDVSMSPSFEINFGNTNVPLNSEFRGLAFGLGLIAPNSLIDRFVPLPPAPPACSIQSGHCQ